jgi:hypothetical protein
LAFWSAAGALWLAAFWSFDAAFWSALVLPAGAALWSVDSGLVLAGAFWVAVEEAVLWSVLVEGEVADCSEVGAVLLAALLWSVLLGVLGVWAGGFTGALALSEDAPAGFVVVAAGALALLASVVGVWLLPVAVLAALSAVLFAASAVWFAA